MALVVSPLFRRFVVPLLLLCATGVCLGAAHSESSDGAFAKKLIYYGWDSPDTRYVARRWRDIDQMPFDGLGVHVALDPAKPVRGDGCTGNLLGWQVFGRRIAEPERLPQRAKELREPMWGRVRENFLPVAIATRDQDLGFNWFDEGRWGEITRNWEDLIILARNGGCRGILLDPEHYDYECELFSYRHHREQRSAKSFAEYTLQVFRRGRSLGAIIRREFPTITLAFTYGYGLAAEKGPAGNGLADARYALLPAFLDGLIRGTGENAQFVDLYEQGHGFTQAGQWEAGLRTNREEGLKLTNEPVLYGRFFEVGSSVRLDAEAARMRRAGLSRASEPRNVSSGVCNTLRHAIASSRQYVWLYSEREPRLFPANAEASPYLKGVSAAREFLKENTSRR
jgi:hypothetical protein